MKSMKKIMKKKMMIVWKIMNWLKSIRGRDIIIYWISTLIVKQGLIFTLKRLKNIWILQGNSSEKETTMNPAIKKVKGWVILKI